jgi:hypothetical protein
LKDFAGPLAVTSDGARFRQAGRCGFLSPAMAIYRVCMARLILIILGVLVALMVVSLVISALHFLFWVAIVAVIVVGVLRLGGAMRRHSHQ